MSLLLAVLLLLVTALSMVHLLLAAAFTVTMVAVLRAAVLCMQLKALPLHDAALVLVVQLLLVLLLVRAASLQVSACVALLSKHT
jgi:hypothetical protein